MCGDGDLKVDRYTTLTFSQMWVTKSLSASSSLLLMEKQLEEFQHNTIANFATESKYITTCDAVKEADWIRKFVAKP